MSAMNTRVVIVSLVLAASACTPETPTTASKATTAQPKPEPTPEQGVTEPATTKPTPEPGVLGPAAAASVDARREAVLALLGDGKTAGSLPIIASNPGAAFNPVLDQAMRAPTPAVASTIHQLDAKIDGPMDPAVVARVVRVHLEELRRCIEVGAPLGSSPNGRVRVDFTIGPQGKVTDTALGDSTLAIPSIETCMVRAFGRWRFPSPRDGAVVRVEYPLEVQSML